MKTIKEIVLRSQEKQEYTGKKVSIDTKTNFVSFVGLVKAVFKSDHEGKNSSRFWDRLKPEIEKSDCKKIDDDLFVSPSAVEKFVAQNATTCKKTWGVFSDDGLRFLLQDLGYKKRRATMSSPDAVPSKTLSSPGAAGTSKKNLSSLQEGLLNTREKHLNEQEAILAKRAVVLSERERRCAEKEEQNENAQTKLLELQKRLKQKEQEISAPDMMKFVEQVSSLASKFKAKASQSRRNSSEEPIENSVTPPDSESDKKSDKNKGILESRTPSRSPSPIPGSNEDSPVGDEGEGEVRKTLLF